MDEAPQAALHLLRPPYPEKVSASIARMSVFDIRLCTPFDRKEQIGGWESRLHGIDQALRIFGSFEFFLKHEKVLLREIHSGTRVQRCSNLAMSRDHD